MDEGRDGHAERKHLHSLNATHKGQEHEGHSKTELDAEHCRVTLPQITAGKEPRIHYIYTHTTDVYDHILNIECSL